MRPVSIESTMLLFLLIQNFLVSNHTETIEYTVEPLITVTSAQQPPPDLQSVKKVPAEFKVKLS